MKVLICGDRNWNNSERIHQIISLIDCPKDELTIIEGGARGADKIAGQWCHALGIGYTEIIADWDNQGRKAGPLRNKLMLDLQPDLVIAFHNNIYSSKGTSDTIKQANKMRIPVRLVTDTKVVNDFIYGKDEL